MPVDYRPEGYHTVTPYLVVEGAEKVIDFVVQVLGAKERMRFPAPNNRVGHAEVQIGDSVVMVADAPTPGEVTPGMLHLYVENVDETFRRAVAAGAVALREPATQFYGDRVAGVRDAAGNLWYFATHVEDVSEEEMGRRAAQAAASATQ